MSDRNIKKQATRDAGEYAAAYMAYGEGAGTRRKLIEGTVGYKAEFIPGYREAFEAAHGSQNMADHAKNAKTENRRKKINESVARNTKAVVSGKYENLAPTLLIAGSIAYGMHQTGLDRVVVDAVKTRYTKVRKHFRKKPKTSKRSSDNDGVYRITDVR